MINKKGQEEMTGFALIIIIVAIIGVILLAFMLRKDPVSQANSFEIQQFLDSVQRVQSKCTLQLENTPLRISDLIQECYSNSANTCKSGQSTCASLDNSIKDIIASSWNINPASPYTGFKLDIFLRTSNSSTPPKYILNQSSGLCANNFYGGESFLPERGNSGNFIVRLMLCLSNSTS